MISKLVRSLSVRNDDRVKSTKNSDNGKNDDDQEWDDFNVNFPERDIYCRPEFLQLTPNEEEEACNHSKRPIIFPKYPQQTPLGAGYAE